MRQDWSIAAEVTIASYVLLFIWCVVRNLYREHVALVTRATEVERELQNKPPSKLKIISARYGVAGINDSDVAHCLEERLNGDALAQPIVADLFHGLDPVSGNPNKQLTVHYAFDGHEATITRPEYALLVLPEDPYLKMFTPLQLEVLGVRQGLIDLLAAEPRVERSAFTGLDADARFVTASNKQDERFQSVYVRDLRTKTVALFHQLRIKGMTGSRIVFMAEMAGIVPHFEEMIQTLWTIAAEVKE